MFNKAVLWNLSYGVYIISSIYNKKPTGCVANCAVQLTYNTIAVSLNHSNYTNEIIKKVGKFSISILSEKTNPNIIAVFGFSCGKNRNKFEKIEYEIKNNLPVIKNSTGYLTLKTINTVELETHTLFIGEITGGEILNNDPPMTYKFYHDVIKGRAPKAAPTYLEPDCKEKIQYRCKICGYIYNGDITKEGPDFACPVCKQGILSFERIMMV